MEKMKKLYVFAIAGLLVLSCGQNAVSQTDPNDVANQYVNPEGTYTEFPQALGDATADLVYTPVTPCRMVDTRPAASPSGAFIGPIAGGTTLGIGTLASEYATQGGDGTGCDVVDNPAAIVVSITAVQPEANGYITAWAHGATQPNVAVLNYRTGVNINNTTIIPQDTTAAGDEMDLYTYSTTHIVVDVVGYFDPPAVTTLEMEELESATKSVAAGAYGCISSPTCSTGYKLTGGGAYTFDRDDLVTTMAAQSAGAGDQFYYCCMTNIGSVSGDFTCKALCARVPGK